MSENDPTDQGHMGAVPRDAELADFLIFEQLGAGGSAVVNRATHRTLQIDLALKRWRVTPNDAQRRRFLDECRLQWQLSNHPNIVRLYWAGAPDPGAPWLAMERYECSLADRLRGGPAFDLDEALALADDVLEGLAAIHASGHLHRDIKPANVLLRDGRAALSDLGIAMHVDHLTQDNAAGTARYVAPELYRGSTPSARTDIYSAALTIQAAMPEQLLPKFERLLIRATSFDPADRPADVALMLEQLRDAAGTDTTPRPSLGHAQERHASDPGSAPAETGRGLFRGHRARWIGAGLALAVAGTAVAITLASGGAPSHAGEPRLPPTAQEAPRVAARAPTGHVFLLSRGTLWVLDSSINSVVKRIGVGSVVAAYPTPDGRYVDVLSYGQVSDGVMLDGPGSLTVFDASTLSVDAVIPLGSGGGTFDAGDANQVVTTPTFAFSPDGRTGYASCTDCTELDVVDLSTDRLVRRISTVQASATAITPMPDGRHVLVVERNIGQDVNQPSLLRVYDVTTGRVTASGSTQDYATAPIVPAGGARIFVPEVTFGNTWSPDLDVLSFSLSLVRRVSVNISQDAVVADHMLLSYDGVFGTLIVTTVDLDSLSTKTTTIGSSRLSQDDTDLESWQVVLSRDGHTAYLITAGQFGQGSVYTFDVTTLRIIAITSIGSNPGTPSLDPTGRYIYIPTAASSGPDTVSVFDTVSHKLTSTVVLD